MWREPELTPRWYPACAAYFSDGGTSGPASGLCAGSPLLAEGSSPELGIQEVESFCRCFLRPWQSPVLLTTPSWSQGWQGRSPQAWLWP